MIQTILYVQPMKIFEKSIRKSHHFDSLCLHSLKFGDAFSYISQEQLKSLIVSEEREDNTFDIKVQNDSDNCGYYSLLFVIPLLFLWNTKFCVLWFPILELLVSGFGVLENQSSFPGYFTQDENYSSETSFQ